MATVAERMQVNAAIEKLISGWDEGSARVVIKFGHNIPGRARFSGSVTVLKMGGTSVTGHTAEQGNFSVDVDEKEKIKQWTWGDTKERVGHYKLYKASDGRIEFHHFWASDEATLVNEEDAPTVFVLGYDAETLNPIFFGRWGEHVVFRIPWLIKVNAKNISLLWGTAPDKKNVSYDISIGGNS